jgi:hypothetical protein
MPEIYRKQTTAVDMVLGHYASNTVKMAFAVNYRQQVNLASGKLSKGADPKFLYKMALPMSYSEFLAMLEAFDRCSKDHLNYHEFGEYTDFKGQRNRLVLKTSDYGGLVALKNQCVSKPDEFGDDEESIDPDPDTTKVISSGEVVDWTEGFEKFYISKNEDWSAMARNLREFSIQLADVWCNDPTTSPKTPSFTGENRDPTPAAVLETPVLKRKIPDTAPAVNKKPPKKPRKPKAAAVPTSSGEFEVKPKPVKPAKVVKPKAVAVAKPVVVVPVVESSESSGSEEVRKRFWWQKIGGVYPKELVERDKFFSNLQLVLF